MWVQFSVIFKGHNRELLTSSLRVSIVELKRYAHFFFSNNFTVKPLVLNNALLCSAQHSKGQPCKVSLRDNNSRMWRYEIPSLEFGSRNCARFCWFGKMSWRVYNVQCRCKPSYLAYIFRKAQPSITNLNKSPWNLSNSCKVDWNGVSFTGKAPQTSSTVKLWKCLVLTLTESRAIFYFRTIPLRNICSLVPSWSAMWFWK